MLISEKSTGTLIEQLSTEKEILCSGLFLSARWFVLSEVFKRTGGLHFVILPSSESAEYCSSDLYPLTEGDCVFYLPALGSSSQRSNYISTLSIQRTKALSSVLSYKKGDNLIVVTYPEAVSGVFCTSENDKPYSITLSKGQNISFEDISFQLYEMGFEKVDFVASPGQYAIRGYIIDIFSFSSPNPYRISFWGNEIDRISIFNCNSQLSVSEEDKAEIIGDTLSRYSEEGKNIISCLPSDAVVWLDSSDTYKDMEFFGLLEGFKKVYIDSPVSEKASDKIKFGISPQPVFNKNFDMLSGDIRSRMENGYRVLIYGEKQSQTERLKAILSDESRILPEFVQGYSIHSGFIDSENKVCCYTDHEIFDRFHRVRLRNTVEKSEQLTLNDLSSFNIGDYVVHIDYGIGVFGGLVRMRDDKGNYREVVKLSYKDGDVVFISVHALHKIARYKSKDSEPPRINKLGSKTWVAMKNGAKSKVKDIAKDLINLYAKRKATSGYAFSADSYLQKELESSFMYEDTPDQELTTIAVKRDMEDNCPMDRLVCGDVGFGKTEIAIRAAFKAVSDSKQVAVLVPTTILALQHYHTFLSRLENFPCNIDYVSRLRTAKEISDIKDRLKNGKIDILIGTHKILSDSFEFRDLGLLIIDEEQKFGVSAKERLRQIKSSVDTLTLTATPIPRTLQFSLLGARDLSIINTPPANRIPTQTEIILFDKDEIKSIIEYELNRGGQVFFLHNKVEELPMIEEILHRLVPDMKICTVHGQMESKVLENKMLEFIRGDHDLLLCTTIIENGLDIPNANTIIINQAQNIGLSDLHQLRGRVGRTNRKAFCYLIVPPLASITDDARKRLKAIEEFSDLGSGFNIAMQDLDIRGAGNLLGAEQSGFITDMGFETYQKILAEAMEELGIETGDTARTPANPFASDCTIDTDVQAYIPDSYINVTSEKIRIYKQLDSVSSEKEARRLADVLKDRFGKFPQEVDNLFKVLELRNTGSQLGFDKIIFKNGMLICFFVDNKAYFSSPQFQNVLAKLSSSTGTFEMKQTDTRLKLVKHSVKDITEALDCLKKLQ